MIHNTVVYPVIFEKEDDGYFVTIPDLDLFTQGESLPDAIAMARDAISLWVMNLQDEKKDVPAAGNVKFTIPEGATVSYVDADIAEYRKKYGFKIVRKNCSIPAWLNTRAEEMNLNFSQLLTEALLAKVNA